MKPLLPLALIAILAAIPAPASGCAAAPFNGERVDIASESAVIVWDEANKTEHFIRRATFQSTAYDFGFLVPTPSKPEVEESDDEVFKRLWDITKPKIEHRTRTASIGCGGAAAPKGAADGPEPESGIQILQHKRVGDHDVVSIKFDRTKGGVEAGSAELARWLVSFGYGFGDTLKDWVKPYVENDWVITAFRIVGDKPSEPAPAKGATAKNGLPQRGPNAMRAKPVRLSFKTDRPFYPYSEPADQRDDKAKNVQRLLRVYFVADKRYAGTLGPSDRGPERTNWGMGRTVWADKLQDGERSEAIAKAKLPADVGPREWFLTEFEDHSSPRLGTMDVFFTPSVDQSTVARPTVIVYRETFVPWLIGLAVCLGLPALVLIWLGLKIIKNRHP